MRTLNLGSAVYAPEDPPRDATGLPRYLQNEFQKIAIAIQALAAGHLDPVHVAPAKPRLGDVRLADGADWNPGSGRGVYIFDSAAWVLWVGMP